MNTPENKNSESSSTFDLDRFLRAQDGEYEGYKTALAEIRNGRKESHWVWYIFPQLKQLGRSDTAQYYGIDGIDEVRAYFADPVLRERLVEISQALLDLDESDPVKVLGHTDAMKVKSCMTLFLQVAPDSAVFRAVIDKYYEGQLDDLTLSLV